MSTPTRLRDLGQREYATVYADMQAFTAERDAHTPDEIWVVEHPPVYTLGQAADPGHVLNPGDIPLIRTDRGGQVTYHGPGQVVVYPLLDLKRRQIGPRALVFGIEQVLLDYLQELGISAQRRSGAPGIYCAERKIASIGLRVRKPGCYHGLALNLNMDLEPYNRINPCGYAGMQMTQVADFGTAPRVADAGTALAEKLDRLLHREHIAPLLPQIEDRN